MSRVLAIMPCLPFPAFDGQTHRLSHTVRSLARAHDVSLACMVRYEQKAEMPADLAPLFHEVKLVPITEPSQAILSKIRRRMSDDPLDVFRFNAPEMHAHIRRVIPEFDPEVILLGDPALAQYLPERTDAVVALDYVCEVVLQLERLRDLAPATQRPLWDARRKKFVRFLDRIRDRIDITFLNSREDLESLERYWAPETLHHIANGLELDSYPTGLAEPQPNRLIYPGSVRYPPNRDAVEWFANAILPKIRAERPDVEFRVTGSYDDDAPQAEGLVYTGRVEDVRAEISAAWATVVPLRLGAGGARFKVIESLALGTPIVGTDIGTEGLKLEDGVDYLHAETEEEIAQACLSLLRDPARRAALAQGGRARMEESYSWDRLFAQIDALLQAQTRRIAA